jgi:hypothetical protein
VKSLQTTDDGRQVMAIVHLDLGELINEGETGFGAKRPGTL